MMLYLCGVLLLLKNFLHGVHSAECETETRNYYQGTIVSDPSEYLYSNNYCKYWSISGKQNATVTISFDYMDIKTTYNDTCNQDFLEIGPVQGQKIQTQRYCGSYIPKPFITTIRQDHIWLRFVTDSENRGRGFKLNYIIGFVPSKRSCDENEFVCANQKCIYDKWECNGLDECGDNSDERFCGSTISVPTDPPSEQCVSPNFKCLSAESHILFCFHPSVQCDGHKDCANGIDESSLFCDTDSQTCSKHLDGPAGHFSSPNFPNDYPNNMDCDWRLHLSYPTKTIQLRFTTWIMQNEKDTDYVIVYDGKDENSNIIGKYDGKNRPPPLIESTSNWLLVHFHSDDKYPEKGFNASFQQKGYCLPNQYFCGLGDIDCYDNSQRCDGFWDCKQFGADERGCDECNKDSFSCGHKTAQCYKMRDRCNGNHTCMSYADETNCTIEKCSADIGLFLCKNNLCIYQWWTCDRTNDCGDNSDEENCTFSTPRVIIAAVVGSMVCSLLLVVALGCTCKVYALRMQDQNSGRYETPLSRVHAELIRRRAPPPSYNEAMRTSAPYNEVQNFFRHLHLEASRNRPLPLNPENASHGNRETHDPNIEITPDDVPLISLDNTNEPVAGERSSMVQLIPPSISSDSDEESAGCENIVCDDDSIHIDMTGASTVTATWRSSSAKSSDNETAVIEQSTDSYNHDECFSDTASASISLDNVSLPASESPHKKNSAENPNSEREIIHSSQRSHHGSQNSLESNISSESTQHLI